MLILESITYLVVPIAPPLSFTIENVSKENDQSVYNSSQTSLNNYKKKITNWEKKTKCIEPNIFVRAHKLIEHTLFSLIARPTGAAAEYLLMATRPLTEDNTNQTNERKSYPLQHLCDALQMTQNQLQQCTHTTDITKTCRKITRFLYPNNTDCAKLTIKLIDRQQLDAIHGIKKDNNKNWTNYLF